MTSTCEGYLDAGVYEANLWSFLKMDVEAVPGGAGAWPSEKRIRLFPLATDDYALASGGALELSSLERAPAYTCDKAGRPANRKKPTRNAPILCLCSPHRLRSSALGVHCDSWAGQRSRAIRISTSTADRGDIHT